MALVQPQLRFDELDSAVEFSSHGKRELTISDTDSSTLARSQQGPLQWLLFIYVFVCLFVYLLTHLITDTYLMTLSMGRHSSRCFPNINSCSPYDYCPHFIDEGI